MARSSRNPDIHSVGRSTLVPFREGEHPRARHDRRLTVAIATRVALEEWCGAFGIRMTVSNGGHHWRFTASRGRLAEWWPSSAKLVFEAQYERGIHVHDYTQVKAALLKRWHPLGQEATL